MLWLSGLMGLLAVGAFTLLWFLPVRKTVESPTSDEDTVAMANALMGPKVDAASENDPVLQYAGSDEDAATATARMAPEVSDAADLGEDAALVGCDTREFSQSEFSQSDDDDVGAAHAGAPNRTADTPDDEAADWFATEAGTPQFEAFDPAEDDLVVVWDDTRGAVPDVTVVRNDDDPSIAQVILGDTILAQFQTRSDVIYDQLSLVPLSRARTLGWA